MLHITSDNAEDLKRRLHDAAPVFTVYYDGFEHTAKKLDDGSMAIVSTRFYYYGVTNSDLRTMITTLNNVAPTPRAATATFKYKIKILPDGIGRFDFD